MRLNYLAGSTCVRIICLMGNIMKLQIIQTFDLFVTSLGFCSYLNLSDVGMKRDAGFCAAELDYKVPLPPCRLTASFISSLLNVS